MNDVHSLPSLLCSLGAAEEGQERRCTQSAKHALLVLLHACMLPAAMEKVKKKIVHNLQSLLCSWTLI